MRLSTISVGIEAGDGVKAHYTPGSVTWLKYAAPVRHSDLVHVWIGEVTLYGPPAMVVELLGRALREAYAAWGDGNPGGPDGGAAAAVAPPAPPTDMNGEGER